MSTLESPSPKFSLALLSFLIAILSILIFSFCLYLCLPSLVRSFHDARPYSINGGPAGALVGCLIISAFSILGLVLGALALRPPARQLPLAVLGIALNTPIAFFGVLNILLFLIRITRIGPF